MLHDFKDNVTNFPGNTFLNVFFEKLDNDNLCVDLENDSIFHYEVNETSLNNIISKARADAYKSITALGSEDILETDANVY